MAAKDIILIGGGGHCKSCIDVIESTGLYRIIGILDLPEKLNQKLLSYDIIGSDEDIPKYAKQGVAFLITAGHIKSASVRKKIYDQVKSVNGILETIIASTAHVSSRARVGDGTIIMHHALVNAAAHIGSNCIVNSHALVEHDTRVNNHVHISTMSVINGGCSIGSGSFIGSNSVVNQEITISNDVTIGSGSVVHRDISSPGVYAGNPFKKL
jgi:sugar O-acyltransferase (sialic acid O-acetyltransferase NeuD family)